MTLSIVIWIVTALALGAWFKLTLASVLDRRRNARVYLTVSSAECENIIGTSVPLNTAHFWRDLPLSSIPAPGTELDGLGTGPIPIARVVIDPDSQVSCFIQLATLQAPQDNLAVFQVGLEELGWKLLPMSPPYPSPGPNNSFKPKPLRGSA